MRMRPSLTGAINSPGATEEPLGAKLKSYFDHMALGPVPDRLIDLTEALEAAFDRGELRCCKARVKPL